MLYEAENDPTPEQALGAAIIEMAVRDAISLKKHDINKRRGEKYNARMAIEWLWSTSVKEWSFNWWLRNMFEEYEEVRRQVLKRVRDRLI